MNVFPDGRRRRSRPLSPFLPLIAVLLSASLLGAATSRAEETEAEPFVAFEPSDRVPEIWTRTANEYANDPQAHAADLIALGRDGALDLPPEYKVVLADAYLRTGQAAQAQQLFAEVREAAPGYPWNEFASLGLGAVEMSRGDGAAAEAHFAAVLESPEQSVHLLGNLGRGQAFLASGRPEEARAAFDAAAANDAMDPQFRQAGSFGSALARHAAGDSEGAIEALEALAESDPDGPLSRDARYAAARIRLETGEREASITALQGLLAECDEEERSGRVSASLRRLDGRAVGRAWLRNYQENSWLQVMGTGRTMYSIGPCRLSRSTLREAGVTELAAPRVVPAGVAGSEVGTSAAAPESQTVAGAAAPVQTAPPVREAEGSTITLWIVAAAALALIAVVWRLRASRG